MANPPMPPAPPLPPLPRSQQAAPLNTQAGTPPRPQTGPTAAGNPTQTNASGGAPAPGINTQPRPAQMTELLNRITPPPVSLPALGALPALQGGVVQPSNVPVSPRRPNPVTPDSMPNRPLPPAPITPRPQQGAQPPAQAAGGASAQTGKVNEGPPPPTDMPPLPTLPQPSALQASGGAALQAGQASKGLDAPKDAPAPLPPNSPRGYNFADYFASQKPQTLPSIVLGTASSVVLTTRPGNTATSTTAASTTPAAPSTTTTDSTSTSTTSTSSTSPITTTSNTTSTVSTTVTGTAPSTVKEEEGRGRQRGDTISKRRRGKSQEALRLVIKELPAKLTPPGKLAEKLARGESGDFASVATKRQNPIYRLGIAAPKYKTSYARGWSPLLLVMEERLEDALRKTEALVAESEQWTAMIAKWDKAADEAAGAQTAGRGMPSRDLNKIPEVKQLAAVLLEPILAAVRGDGDNLLSSSLGPTWLNFLLELDRQHTSHWEARSKRLLEFQILYFKIEALQKAATTSSSDMNAQFSTLQKLKEASTRWAQNQQARKAEGEDGRAELEALDKLTKAKAQSTQQLDKLREQLKTHDEDFRETRHLAMQAFIGIRGVCTLAATRHENDPRPFKALDGLMAYFLAESPLIDRILKCTEQERSVIDKAATRDLMSLQQAWKKQPSDAKTGARLDKLLQQMKTEKPGANTETSSVKAASPSVKGEKTVTANPVAPGSAESPPSTSSSSSPTKPKPAPRRSSQPNSLRPPDREARRETTLKRFLKSEGITSALTKVTADLWSAQTLTGLGTHLHDFVKTAKQVNKQILLKEAYDYLDRAFKAQASTNALPGVVISKLKGDLEESLLQNATVNDSTDPDGKPETGKKD